MFDIGFSELFVIALVALLVLGPERLPKAARFAGLWVRRARAQWYSVKSELEHELADDELKRSLLQTRDQFQDDLRQARDDLQHGAQTLRRGFETDDAPPEPPPPPAAVLPDPVDENKPVGGRPVDTRPTNGAPVHDDHDRR